MTLTTGPLRAATAAVCARDGADVAGLPAADLLALVDEVARVRKRADLLMAQVATEVGRRSDADVGAGLAGTQGFRSAREFVAHATGGSVAEAKRLIVTGELLAEAEASGEPGADASDEADARTPIAVFRAELRDAVRAGRVGIDVAAAFTAALADVPEVERTCEMFSRALAKAPGMALHQVRKLVWRAQALADPAAWAERERLQEDSRAVSISDAADGMVTLTARLTPLAAAPVRAALDAGVRWAMQQRRDDPGSDPRTPSHMRADILVDLCRHGLDCDQATSGVKTTVVVRMRNEDLVAGLGLGEIDGTSQPVSVEVLRRAAADAEVVPAVLGARSEVLDWGRARRLFSPAQRLALVERDGGCAWCNAPPSWCEAHHIRWWERDAGPTNLANGVLLCTKCHHRVHRDGWEIEIRDGVATFVPPRSVDPARTPRVGGREKFTIAA